MTIHNVDDNSNLLLKKIKPNPFTGESIDEQSTGTRSDDHQNNIQ
jgi:hypothetical protein